MRKGFAMAVAAALLLGASVRTDAQRRSGGAGTSDPHAGAPPPGRTVTSTGQQSPGTVPQRPPSVPERPPSVPQRPASVPTRPPSVPSHATNLPALPAKPPVRRGRGAYGYGGRAYVPFFFGAPFFFGTDLSAYPADTFSVAAASPPPVENDVAAVPPPAPTGGGVYLDVQPATAQVYVDGYYVGTVADFNSSGGALSAGLHQLELRAPDHETVGVPMSISTGRTITYRATMRQLPGTLPAATPATQRLYVISGCYAGNVPPTASSVPPGCDPAQARVLELPH